DFARAPLLGEERFERAVKTQHREPAFLRVGLYPVAIAHALGFGRSEIHGRRPVGAGLGGWRRIALAAGARLALRSVEHRARLVVVNGEGPELPRRDVSRQANLIC